MEGAGPVASADSCSCVGCLRTLGFYPKGVALKAVLDEMR